LNRYDLYCLYIDHLYRHLNRVHGVDRSRIYWEQLIGPWLMMFIWQVAYFYESSKQLDYSTIEQDKPFSVPYDFLSYLNLFYLSDYAYRLDYLIKNPQKIDKILDYHCVKYTNKAHSSLKQIALGVAAWITRFCVAGAQVVMVSPYLSIADQVRIMWRSKFKVIPLFFQNNVEPIDPIDIDMRNWYCKRSAFKGSLDELIYNLVLKQMPYVHMEGYIGLHQNIPPWTPCLRLIFSAVGWSGDESLKLFAAEMRERGVLLVGMQHGGNPYGTGVAPMVKLEQSMVDLYLTWGWKYRERDVPFIAVKFSQQKIINTKKSFQSTTPDSILFVSTYTPKFFPDNLGMPSGDQIESYLEDERRFFESLSSNRRNEIRIRVHVESEFYGWRQREQLEELGLNLKFDNATPYVDAVFSSKLVVCDNFNSTFTEALIYNIPTILFFDPQLYPLNGSFQKLFQRMNKAGIIHIDPLSAANHIEKIGDNPLAWWNSLEIIELRDEFLSLYGDSENDPLGVLVIKLKSLLNTVNLRVKFSK